MIFKEEKDKQNIHLFFWDAIHRGGGELGKVALIAVDLGKAAVYLLKAAVGLGKVAVAEKT